MKRAVILGVIVTFLVVFLGGCEGLLTLNLFSRFGQPDLPGSAEDVSDIVAENSGDTQGLIDALTEIADTDAFYESLDELTAEEKAAIINSMTDALHDIFANPEAPVEERQQAALLTADVILSSNPEAKAAVDSVVDVALGAMDGSVTFDSLDGAIESVLESAFEGVEDIELALEALIVAGDAFTAYGETLPDDVAASAAKVTAKGYDIDAYAAIAGDALVALSLGSFSVHYYAYKGVVLTTKSQIIEVVSNPLDPVNSAILSAVADDLLAPGSAFRRLWNAAGLDVLIDLDAVTL